jgi:hypothetical protein
MMDVPRENDGAETTIFRIGGTAWPEPRPERELSNLMRIASEEELSDWMRDYEAGKWFFVRIELFADVLTADGVARYCGHSVPALSFIMPHGEDNIDHASEIVRSSVEAIAATLQVNGVAAAPDDLASMPIVIEVCPELERLFAA